VTVGVAGRGTEVGVDVGVAGPAVEVAAGVAGEIVGVDVAGGVVLALAVGVTVASRPPDSHPARRAASRTSSGGNSLDVTRIIV